MHDQPTPTILRSPPPPLPSMVDAAQESRRLEASLRAPQVLGLNSVYEAWARGHAALLNLPTGVGKTRAGLTLVARARLQGARCLWLAHRDELIEQPLEAWGAGWPSLVGDAGVVKGDRNAVDKPFVIASVQTLAKPERLAAVLAAGAFGLIVVDEAHHYAGVGQWTQVLEAVAAVGAPKLLGLTATIERADKLDLGARWHLAFSFPISRAISEGYLVPPVLQVLPLDGVDLDVVKADFKKEDGDYDVDAYGDYLLQNEIVPHTVTAVRRYGEGRKGVVFTCNVEQATLTAAALNQAGIVAEVIHGNVSPTRRRTLLRAHKAGEISQLCNADLLTEGYDDPSISLVTLCRPARSKALFLQILGRGLRLSPGKVDCLVLDCAAASKEHGLFTTPALVGKEARERDPNAPKGPPPPPRLLFSGLFEARERSRFAWTELTGLDRQAFAIGVGKGYVILAQERPGLDVWRVLDAPKGALVTAVMQGLSGEDAQAAGDDLVRRAGAAKLTAKDEPWRDAPPSDPQVALLAKNGLPACATRAEANTVLTRFFATRRIVAAQFARRTS